MIQKKINFNNKNISVEKEPKEIKIEQSSSNSYEEIENLFVDFEEYKNKYLEIKKNKIENFINNKDINDKDKIIQFLESEFYFLEEQQKAIYYSNEEMNKYYDNDKEIAESRAENVKILFKNFERMKKIKEDLLGLDKYHYMKDKNILSNFKFEEEKYNNSNYLLNNPLIEEFIDRSDLHKEGDENKFEEEFNNFFSNKNNVEENLDDDNKDKILDEIDL